MGNEGSPSSPLRVTGEDLHPQRAEACVEHTHLLVQGRHLYLDEAMHREDLEAAVAETE